MRGFAVRILLGITLVLLSLQAQSGAAPPSIRVHGESLISVAPDEAEMDIGVVSEGATTEAAIAQNTATVNRVLESLRPMLPAASIKTINLAINPIFRYPKDGAPIMQGYTADHTLRVTINNLEILRPVIAAATKAGASSVNRLNLTLRAESDRKARAHALAEASQQAAAGATALAASLKVKLGRILRIEEEQPLVISPAPTIDLGKAQSTDMTPISPGDIQIHANVNLEYEILYPSRR